MTDRYINPATGVNTGAGGSGAPWATLNYALGGTAATAAGDTIFLRGGNYAEFVVPRISGTLGSPITIKAYTGETPNLLGASGTPGILEIPAGISYLNFEDDLYFSYGHSAPGGSYQFPWINILSSTASPTHHLVFKNFQMERAGWSVIADLMASPWKEWGIKVEAGNDLAFDGLWLRGMRQGIQLKNECLRPTIQYCDIGHTYQSGIVCAHSNLVDRAGLIWHNLIHDSAIEDGIQFMQNFDAIADSVDDSNRGMIIAYNQIYDNGENAIDFKGTTNHVVHGNLIWGTLGSNDGLHPTLGSNFNSMMAIGRGASTYSHRVIIRYNILVNNCGAISLFPYWKAYNNTLIKNNTSYAGSNQTASTASPRYYGIRQPGVTPGNGSRNNLFVSHSQANVSFYAGSNQPNNEMDTDYNIYVGNKWRDKTADVDYTDIAAWRAKLATNNWRYGKDGASFVVSNHAALQFENVPEDPTGDPTTYNFALKSTSPAKGAGGWITRTVGAATNTNQIVVADATWFSDMFGRAELPEKIFVEGQERTVTDVDDSTNTLTLSANVTVGNDKPVYHVAPGQTATATPDIGAGAFYSSTGTPTPPPAATGTGGRVMTTQATATATGHQAIPLPAGLSVDPTFWRFIWTLGTTSGTVVDGLSYGEGFAWDNGGTAVNGAISMRAKHNSNPSANTRRTSIVSCVMIQDPVTGNIDGEGEIILSESDKTQVTINWTNAPGAAYQLTVIAEETLKDYAGSVDIPQNLNSTVTISLSGWSAAPQIIYFWMNGQGPHPISSTHARLSIGWATRAPGGTITQQCYTRTSDNGLSPTKVGAYISNAYVAAECDTNGAIQRALEITTWSNTQIILTVRVGAFPDANRDGFIAAVGYDNLDVYSGVIALPTAATNTHNVAVGMTAASLELLATLLTAINTNQTAGSAESGALAHGVWAENCGQASLSASEEHNQTTSDTQTLTNTAKILYMPNDAGDTSTGNKVDATVTGTSGNNVVVDFDDVPGTARYALALAVEKPVVVSITPGLSADVSSGVAPLDVVFTDTSSATGTTITEHTFNAGDGSANVTTAGPWSHTYTAAGTYSATLTVGDGSIAATVSVTITVTDPPPTPPSTTGERVQASVDVPTLATADFRASVDVIRGATVDHKIWWTAYGSADANTRYEVWTDLATPNTFVSLATNLSPHSNGAGGYTPRTSTLAVELSASALALTLASGGGAIFANSDPVKIDRETVVLGGESGNAYNAISRGQHNTLRSQHANGTTVYKMHEYYDHTSVAWDDTHAFRYRIFCIHGGVRFIAAECVAVSPGTLPTSSEPGVPPHNDLCVVWGIEDKLDGTPIAGAAVTARIPQGILSPGTAEAYNATELPTTTNIRGYWQLVLPKDRARLGSGTMILIVAGRTYTIATIPNDKNYVHYSECVSE